MRKRIRIPGMLPVLALLGAAFLPDVPYVVRYQSRVSVPGTSETFELLTSPHLGSAGELTFAAWNSRGLISPQSILSDATGELRLVAEPGLPAPGTESTWTRVWAFEPAVGAGRIAFKAAFQYDEIEGLWWGTAYEDVELLALAGNPAPGFPNTNLLSTNFTAFLPPVADRQGNVAFKAYPEGIWRARPGEEPQLVAYTSGLADAEGTPPYETWAWIDAPLLNGAGQLVFRGATCVCAAGEGVGHAGIWIQDDASARLRQVARGGDEAPGAGGRNFGYFESLDLDESGNISFIAQVQNGGFLQGGVGSGIWSGPPGNPRLVALGGDPAPGTNGFFHEFLRFGGNADPREYYGDLEAGSGGVFFSGRLTDLYTDGIWVWRDGAVELVALEGDPAPGTAGDHFSRLTPPGAHFPYAFQANETGVAIFYADLESGGWAVWAYAHGGIGKLLAKGDTVALPGGPGALGGMNLGEHAIDDAGRVAAAIWATDERNAIVVFAPEPNALLALCSGVVLVAILRDRRRSRAA